MIQKKNENNDEQKAVNILKHLSNVSMDSIEELQKGKQEEEFYNKENNEISN